MLHNLDEGDEKSLHLTQKQKIWFMKEWTQFDDNTLSNRLL